MTDLENNSKDLEAVVRKQNFQNYMSGMTKAFKEGRLDRNGRIKQTEDGTLVQYNDESSPNNYGEWQKQLRWMADNRS